MTKKQLAGRNKFILLNNSRSQFVIGGDHKSSISWLIHWFMLSWHFYTCQSPYLGIVLPTTAGPSHIYHQLRQSLLHMATGHMIEAVLQLKLQLFRCVKLTLKTTQGRIYMSSLNLIQERRILVYLMAMYELCEVSVSFFGGG